MNETLRTCLTQPTRATATETVADWWPQWLALGGRGARPAELSLIGGFQADRVGWAFAAGYQAALRALHPALPHETMAALCVTEEGGNRPRDIRTTVAPLPEGGYRLDGAKRWTTLGPAAGLLLVVGAMAPDADTARPSLKVARVPTGTPGLELSHMPPTRFVPEVPHARLRLSDVRVAADALLPGDGYATVVKPFRTIEDIHVTLAVLAYLLREARARDWPSQYRESLFSAMLQFSTLAEGDPGDPALHLALAGALHQAAAIHTLADALWAADDDDPAAQRWQRDRALFGSVAAQARDLRAARAWQRVVG